MRKRAMAEIMAQTGKLNALYISLRDPEFRLLVLKVFNHTTSQVGDTWEER
jgi:hypothetical protein